MSGQNALTPSSVALHELERTRSNSRPASPSKRVKPKSLYQRKTDDLAALPAAELKILKAKEKADKGKSLPLSHQRLVAEQNVKFDAVEKMKQHMETGLGPAVDPNSVTRSKVSAKATLFSGTKDPRGGKPVEASDLFEWEARYPIIVPALLQFKLRVQEIDRSVVDQLFIDRRRELRAQRLESAGQLEAEEREVLVHHERKDGRGAEMAKLGFTKRSQAFDPTPDTIPKAEVRRRKRELKTRQAKELAAARQAELDKTTQPRAVAIIRAINVTPQSIRRLRFIFKALSERDSNGLSKKEKASIAKKLAKRRAKAIVTAENKARDVASRAGKTEAEIEFAARAARRETAEKFDGPPLERSRRPTEERLQAAVDGVADPLHRSNDGEVMYSKFVLFCRTAEAEAFLKHTYETIVYHPNAASTRTPMVYEDFALIVLLYCTLTKMDVLRLAFRMFDSDDSGRLEEHEFNEMAAIINNYEPAFPGSFRSALQNFDTDRDGLISFSEFCDMNEKYPLALFPVYKLQDALQKLTFGSKVWTGLLNTLTKEHKYASHIAKYGTVPEPALQVPAPHLLGTLLPLGATLQSKGCFGKEKYVIYPAGMELLPLIGPSTTTALSNRGDALLFHLAVIAPLLRIGGVEIQTLASDRKAFIAAADQRVFKKLGAAAPAAALQLEEPHEDSLIAGIKPTRATPKTKKKKPSLRVITPQSSSKQSNEAVGGTPTTTTTTPYATSPVQPISGNGFGRADSETAATPAHAGALSEGGSSAATRGMSKKERAKAQASDLKQRRAKAAEAAARLEAQRRQAEHAARKKAALEDAAQFLKQKPAARRTRKYNSRVLDGSKPA